MKNIFTNVLCASLLVFMLVGCGKSSESNLSNTTVTGQVTTIDGNSVTLLLGELTENEMAGAPADGGEAPSGDGTPPSGAPSGDGTPPSGAPSGGGTPPSDTPSGDTASGEAQSAQLPSGGCAMPSFTVGTDSTTITITDSTAITIEGMGEGIEGTIADITVDSILEVCFGDDNTVSTIIVKNITGGPAAKS
ncbi:MAG: hypothetical protein KBI01_05475 [Oscillospiraceae bacterium]|nr:hypothetical protein [Oscillospiraceae bacterium]